MKTQIYLSFLITSMMSYSVAVSAVTISQPWQRSTTEAGSCEGGRCLAGTQQKSNILQFCESMRERAAWAQDWTCQNASIFDDGNDRSILYDLRRKRESSLTAEERAVLQAADRYGNVGFCRGASGNATLIMHNGRPAIVTSAHILIDATTGRSKCSASELASAIYMPNVSYYDRDSNEHPESFTHRRVRLEVPGVNMDMERRVRGSNFHQNDDFVIFYLAEDITRDVMPRGHIRGAMSVASNSPRTGQLYMIGVAPDVRQSMAVVQQSCRYNDVMIVGFRHNCDTVNGSSGSLLAVMEDGELRLRAIHHGDQTGGQVVPETNEPGLWNFGTDLQANSKL